ncbi:hypothetical protein [Streptomyces cylindrosporus]|uniref:DUF4375 domain-containing protein n=1 Tax=Streptomyces cylindrosporus TaxID=2927583 RepID=A0ABS9Y5R2_9ACTN|nr:hypothetical protein [Streptomyces cylindrosporus]MCI3272555.1 hypothetical protein [Streptomyces cylindrosporus]
MGDIEEAVEHAERLRGDERMKVGALLLVRYCGFHRDRRFSPWFENEREALARVAQAGADFVRGAGSATDLAELKTVLRGVLEENDPDGPPFAAEIFDHLVFADEVLDFIGSPDSMDLLGRAFERAEELAEGHEEMGRDDWPTGDWEPVEFARLESEARDQDVQGDLDPSVALPRSEAFSRLYADFIAGYYRDEDAGINS